MHTCMKLCAFYREFPRSSVHLQAAQQAPKPLYDPNGTDAIVLNDSEWAHGEGKDAKGRPVVAVVVDPYLSRCGLHCSTLP